MHARTFGEGLFPFLMLMLPSATSSMVHSYVPKAETKDINSSLMALKECIRARTRASKFGAASDTSCFVPYRRNKLTLLMKDIFDIGCQLKQTLSNLLERERESESDVVRAGEREGGREREGRDRARERGVGRAPHWYPGQTGHSDMLLTLTRLQTRCIE